MTAERGLRRVERVQLQVYGTDSLDVALTRSNLGRSLVDQQRFAEAARVLDMARAGFVAQAGDGVDTLANLEDSLGLAQGGLGDTAGARAAFQHGLAAARKHAMPKEIELLADRGELECPNGARAAGLVLVGQVRPALARFALPEPWRRARLNAVEGVCLIATGRKADAKGIARSLPLVVARWGLASLFGRSITQDARRIGLVR